MNSSSYFVCLSQRVLVFPSCGCVIIALLFTIINRVFDVKFLYRIMESCYQGETDEDSMPLISTSDDDSFEIQQVSTIFYYHYVNVG